uniref:uncharacterized protein LOC117609911 n=1 Tax=Osmia lignaria TaxID=473952 RepID=UPI00147895B1|nr:uncharacterized protein LOC117609911 [Osmia lignaria]
MSTGSVQSVCKKTVRARCIRCNIMIRKSYGSKKKINSVAEAVKFSRILDKVVVVGDVLCNNCHNFIYKSSQFTAIESFTPSPSTSSVTLSNFEASLTPTSQIPSSSATTSFVEEPLPGTSRDVSSSISTSVLETFVPEANTSSSLQESSSYSDPTLTIDQSFVLDILSDESNFEHIEVPFSRVVTSHLYCFVCGSKRGIINVPFETRKQVFAMRRLYVPEGNRCCPSHLLNKRLYHNIIERLDIHSNSSLVEANELRNYFELIATSSDSEIENKVGDFTLSEELLKVLTGLTWENIISLRELMTSMQSSETRNIIQAIIVFLFKLRTGSSNSMIAAILGLEYEQVSNFCKFVLTSFQKDILPIHFGFGSFSREYLIDNETSDIAKQLCNISNQLALVFDGTYIRHQTSTNNEYQRKSYSDQNNVPLCKPYTVCTTNGYVVDVLGPFHADQNDAQIMKTILQDLNGLQSIMKRGDICIGGREFHDVQSSLKELGFQVLMPVLNEKRNQLTTVQSNASRRITKINSVVEAIHAIIVQNYKLLHRQIYNKSLPQIQLLFKIACFLYNRFSKRLNYDIELSHEIIERMRSQPDENTLAIDVEKYHWNRRKIPFKRVSTTELLEFPELSENKLKILFTGSYQLSQAISYLAETIDVDNNINIFGIKHKDHIVKFQIQSRHINGKTYSCYIDYTPDSINISGIKRYCCECVNGNRTIGCCSHVAAIIYYLSYARYQARIVRPAELLSTIFRQDEIMPVINEDSDED